MTSFNIFLNHGFDVPTIKELDQFRYKRNSSKYYGVSISVKEAKEIKKFYKRIKSKIDEILKKEMLR